LLSIISGVIRPEIIEWTRSHASAISETETIVITHHIILLLLLLWPLVAHATGTAHILLLWLLTEAIETAEPARLLLVCAELLSKLRLILLTKLLILHILHLIVLLRETGAKSLIAAAHAATHATSHATSHTASHATTHLACIRAKLVAHAATHATSTKHVLLIWHLISLHKHWVRLKFRFFLLLWLLLLLGSIECILVLLLHWWEELILGRWREWIGATGTGANGSLRLLLLLA
jgi:hypothetical protein